MRADGRPHLVPVWFLWDGETLLIFSEPEKQKVRNLRANGQVSLALRAWVDLAANYFYVFNPEGTQILQQLYDLIGIPIVDELPLPVIIAPVLLAQVGVYRLATWRPARAAVAVCRRELPRSDRTPLPMHRALMQNGTMRAVQITEFGGPEVLNIIDLPDPEPAAGQVLVEVSRAGCQRGVPHANSLLQRYLESTSTPRS